MAASHCSRNSTHSYSPPRGKQLSSLPRLLGIPFLGLTVVPSFVISTRCAQHGQGTTSIGRGLYMERLTAGSTAATRKCLLITRKIMIPPPDSRDPLDGPRISRKKVSPLTAGTHQLHLRTQGSASGQKKQFTPLTTGTHQLYLRTQGSASGQKNKTIRPPDCWDPPATSSQARKCLTVGAHLVDEGNMP